MAAWPRAPACPVCQVLGSYRTALTDHGGTQYAVERKVGGDAPSSPPRGVHMACPGLSPGSPPPVRLPRRILQGKRRRVWLRPTAGHVPCAQEASPRVPADLGLERPEVGEVSGYESSRNDDASDGSERAFSKTLWSRPCFAYPRSIKSKPASSGSYPRSLLG
jgi:hypothetical protein